MNQSEPWIPEQQKPQLEPRVQAQVDLFILGELQKKKFSTFFYSLWTITKNLRKKKRKGRQGKEMRNVPC